MIHPLSSVHCSQFMVHGIIHLLQRKAAVGGLVLSEVEGRSTADGLSMVPDRI
jgi:hypothetical protein